MATDAQVSISRIGTETLRVPILGTAPLIVHRFSEKAKRQTPADARPVVDSPVYCGPPSVCAAVEATAAARGLLPWLAR